VSIVRDALLGKTHKAEPPLAATGHAIYDVTLYQVKTPAETKYPWDYFKPIEVLPEALIYRSPDAAGCPASEWR
jgi:hypothetical protein